MAFAGLVSNTYPVTGIFSMLFDVDGANQYSGIAFVWADLGLTVATVLVFYELGMRIDFASNHRTLAALSFAGAVAGNLPGLYLYSTRDLGLAWGSGFGYVMSYGFPEPSSLIDLLTSALSMFLIPMAGLALAYFQYQRPILDQSLGLIKGVSRSRRSIPPFPIVAFTTILGSYPLDQALVKTLHTQIPLFSTAPFALLLPGYAQYVSYPVLFLVAFYLMGRKLEMDEGGLMRFALLVFSASIAGVFLGGLVGTYISQPASVFDFMNAYNLLRLAGSLMLAGVTAAALGFAAVVLGRLQ